MKKTQIDDDSMIGEDWECTCASGKHPNSHIRLTSSHRYDTQTVYIYCFVLLARIFLWLHPRMWDCLATVFISHGILTQITIVSIFYWLRALCISCGFTAAGTHQIRYRPGCQPKLAAFSWTQRAHSFACCLAYLSEPQRIQWCRWQDEERADCVHFCRFIQIALRVK